jgi:hypothetical protein
MKTKTSLTRNSIGWSSRHCRTVAALLIALVLACFALSPIARAVDPPPDGGYPGGNTAEGEDALLSLTTGEFNTAIGFQALFSNLTGNGNTATGSNALGSNTTGSSNTACGASALASNTEGSFNTAIGGVALLNNTTGNANTAIGENALQFNTSGHYNTAVGLNALEHNTTGTNNLAVGFFALTANISGHNNTACGFHALQSNGGNGNIALGHSAGANLNTGNDNIDIGNAGIAGESKTIRIGTKPIHTATFIAGISGTTIGGGVGVIIDSSGHLGTAVSSARFKDAIKPMAKESEAILALKPVTFRYKKEFDPAGIPQFGLVAEEVEKVNPDLVARDEEGKPYSVRYEAVNAMLLNEFLKEHRKLEEQGVTIAKQGATIEQQQKQIEALTNKIQTISDQLRSSLPTQPNVAKNP